jgi:quinoprotein dehydrogenase-associated probable ABC transporter substrate-binding protein
MRSLRPASAQTAQDCHFGAGGKNNNAGMRRLISLLLGILLVAPAYAQAGTLRVCADPNNLPFSNRAGHGFENRIARLAAHDLSEKLQYDYAAQNARFVEHTLDAGKCDVIMGVPVGFGGVATTRPYYASTYVFVSRRPDDLALSSFGDPRLRRLRIGVHLIGDDSTPPLLALGQEGIVNNVQGFLIDGDLAKPNPPARLIEAVENHQIDVAAVWGPFGGYFAKRAPAPLVVTPVTDTARFAPLQFSFPIAMAVRKDNPALRLKLDAFIVREGPAIRNILEDYGVPLVEIQGGSHG